jgi:serine/threonine-protein kinase HipA
LRNDSTSWLGQDFGGQFSLAGAQAKTALHFTGGTWGVSTGSAPTTHILKPGLAAFAWHHLNEHVCLSAARRLGLQAAKSTMTVFEGEPALIIERFDRVERGGSFSRVHQEDLCQALSIPPVRKYQSDGGPSPGRIADLLRSVIPGPAAEEDVWRFLDALAFNWLIAGTDAHAKNYGLLLSGNQVRLAPLYDLASFLPYDDSKGHGIGLAMKLGGEYRLRRTDRSGAWEKTADEIRVDRTRAVDRVRELARGIPAAFALAISEESVTALGSDLPARLLDLVAARAALCTKLLE